MVFQKWLFGAYLGKHDLIVFTQHQHTHLGGKSGTVRIHVKGTFLMLAFIDIEYLILRFYTWKVFLFLKDQYYF